MIKNVEIDGQELYYSESGPDNGVKILLMHGWGCNHTTLACIENLLNKHMHVYCIDFPGHGQSPEPKQTWGVELYTQLVEKFIDRVGGDIHILLGHSFGGRVGILLASRNSHIKKLLLVDAAGIKPHRPLKYYFKVYSYKTVKHIYLALYGRRKAEAILENKRKKHGSADYANATPQMRAILSRCVNEDLKNVMPRIKASTLLIWGENDTATPLKDAKTMERLIPDAGLVSFENCGHYSFLDNPIAFNAVITNFLQQEMQ